METVRAVREAWRQALGDSRTAAGVGQARISALRAAVGQNMAREELSPGVDLACAEGWGRADPHFRAQIVRGALEGLPVGPKTLRVWLESVTGGERISAEAAVVLLRATPSSIDDPLAWRALARRAIEQRADPLPAVSASSLIAERGPAGCLPTVALTAFRPGPEDAEDRHIALAALGRFDHPELVHWLCAAQRSAFLALPAVQGLDRWLGRHPLSAGAASSQSEGSATQAARLLALKALRGGAGIGPDGLSEVSIDATQRWVALEALSRAELTASLPALVGAWRAGGEALPPWYLPSLIGRIRALLETPAEAALDLASALERMARRETSALDLSPLVSDQVRVGSPCPRIANAALVRVQASTLPETLRVELLSRRASLDKALLNRGQLLTSVWAQEETDSAQLSGDWAPSHAILDAPARVELKRQEAAWLAG